MAEGSPVTLDFMLRISPFRTAITVTATGREQVSFRAVQTVLSLDAFDLSESMATSLGEVLDGGLGIAKRSFGAGNARPVIRGFDGDRVLVMQDGISVGSLGSQSGDHGEPVDASNVERIEVLKGPATLPLRQQRRRRRRQRNQPSSWGPHPTASRCPGSGVLVPRHGERPGGQQLQRRNRSLGTGWAGLGAAASGLRTIPLPSASSPTRRAASATVTRASAGSPTGALPVSTNKANDGRYGIPFANEFHGHHEEDEEGEHHEEGEDEHDAAEELARVDLAFRRHNVRFTGGVRNLGSWMDGFELSLNYSDWNHDELEVAGDGDQAIGTTFENQLFSYRGVLTQRPVGRLSGSFGFHGTARRYEAVGEEALSPPVDQNTFALFALEEIAFERVQLQLGGRVETTRYKPTAPILRAHHHHEDEEEGRERKTMDRNTSLCQTGSSPEAQPVSGRGSTFGPAAHSSPTSPPPSGRPPLKSFITSGRMSARLPSKWATRGLSGSVPMDSISRYGTRRTASEEKPTSSSMISRISCTWPLATSSSMAWSKPISCRMGRGSWARNSSWISECMTTSGSTCSVDSVNAELTATGKSLPRIPPLRAALGLDLRYAGLSVRPEVRLAVARNDVFTAETPTPGYAVANLAASYTIPRQHFSHHISVNFFNIGDRLYRNHTSFIKDLVPEIGRGIRFSYAMKFF